MKHLYTLVFLFIISGTTLFAQEPLTDKIVIEFMKPGDPDAKARNYNLVEWPNEAKAAAYKAAEIWASYLEITVPIRIKFGLCDNIESDAKGGAILNYQYTDGLYYPLPLINQLIGYDKNRDVVDIICVFKSDVNWYLGLEQQQQWYNDPNDPSVQYSKNSIIPTMLHEICHGLGINTTFKVHDNKGSWGGESGMLNIYDSFISDKNEKQLVDESIYEKKSEKLGDALISENIFWLGNNAKIANNGTHVKIHAPSIWKEGNSISHISTEYGRTINDLMSNGTGGVTSNNGMDNYYTFTPGPIVLGMLQDMGWTLKSGATANKNMQVKSPIKVYTSKNEIIIEGAENYDKVLVCDFSGRVRYTGNGAGRVNLPSGLFIVRVADQTYKVRL